MLSYKEYKDAMQISIKYVSNSLLVSVGAEPAGGAIIRSHKPSNRLLHNLTQSSSQKYIFFSPKSKRVIETINWNLRKIYFNDQVHNKSKI